MLECISEKTLGPITATLYVTDQNKVIVHGLFHDGESGRVYPGPMYEITSVPQELVNLKQEQPQHYIHSVMWQGFISDLWECVHDHPWYRYI